MNYYIAFWNVENLFDIKDSPNRTDKLNRSLQNELKGWNVAILEKKLDQLSKIILQMNDGSGPDILGLCEVENSFVLELLVEKIKSPTRKYKIAHADTNDTRGFDTAFIYDANKISANELFSHYIQKRTSTRDLLQVNFRTNSGTLLVLINNHWPSRRAGHYKTEPYRMMAGETLAYFHERIRDIYGDETAIMAMGDFNDEPFSRSITEYARAEQTRAKVTRSSSAKFLNLMWPLMGSGIGSYYDNNDPKMFDQFLASKGLITGKSGLKVNLKSVQVLRFAEIVQKGTYPKPLRFGRESSLNKKGFSDHFPIALVIKDF